VATHLGLEPEKLLKTLESFEPNDRFTRTWQAATGSWVIDDGYASNPMGFAAAIELAQELKKQHNLKQVYLIFGGIVDLGSESSAIHSRLAKIAAAVCDSVVYTGDIGRPEFNEVFDTKVISSTEFMNTLADLDEKTAVIIEGRVPAVIAEQPQLKPSKVKT
jgi:UDP-N-acetylmuramyl pentapeptide synthase